MTKHYVNKHGTEKPARQFTLASLQRLLTNPAYIGVRVYGKIGRGVTEAIKAAWEPLIDEELFQKVQARLQSNKNRYKPDEWKRYPFPLTEKILCGECGKNLGGKSVTSQNSKKHFYYEHARQLHGDGVNHLKRCRLERVKAEKMEEVVLKSLKTLIQDEVCLDHWLDIYAKGSQAELPEVKNQLTKLKRDIDTFENRSKNLIERLSDLPKEVSADGIYARIKQNQDRVEELKKTFFEVQSQERKFATQTVSREGLILKLKRSIQNLEKTPVEKCRRIYENLIKFAEVHPLKVKIGIYAPVVTSSTSVLSGGTSRT
jgi:site-specific DNA recombinase